jgi:hypothetical protein
MTRTEPNQLSGFYEAKEEKGKVELMILPAFTFTGLKNAQIDMELVFLAFGRWVVKFF